MATAKDMLRFCSSQAKRQANDVDLDDDWRPLVDESSGSEDSGNEDLDSRQTRSTRGRGRGFDAGVVWHHDEEDTEDEEEEVQEESLLSGVHSILMPVTPGAAEAVPDEGGVSMEESRFDWEE